MRRATGLTILLVTIALVVVASFSLGTRDIPLGEVWHSLWDSVCSWITGAEPPHSQTSQLMGDRLARTLLGLTAGMAIGASGALIQGHSRNPLADPGLLGINAGAACAVVAGTFVWNVGSTLGNVFLALLGAGIASALVFGVSAMSGSSPMTLVLAGTGLSAFLVAITSAMVLTNGGSFDAWRSWNIGSLAGRDMDEWWTTLPFIVVGLVLALAGGFFLNLLSLGDDMATALGGRVLAIRISGVAAITLLAGAATAACGPIAFLGLLVPHLARTITGPDYRWLVPYSALLGGALLLGCDVIGRVIGRPGETQVGVVIALIGGPVLMALVRRRKLTSV